MSLLEQASLVITPNAYKESVLYSVVPNTALGDMDVVRATTATRVNSAGLIEVVPRNLLQFSEQLDNAIWTKSGVTITANSVNSPIGTLTADLVTPTISDASLRQSFLPTAVLQYNFSIWLRSSTGSNFSTTLRAWRDSPFQNISNVVINITTEWQRFNFSFTTLDATTHVIAIGGSSTLSTGENFYSWGAQLDQGSTATEYFPTTTRLNIPRIDYTNGSCPSILVEPQRTNLLTYSNDFTNGWTGDVGITATANYGVSPDGTTTSTRLQFASGSLIWRKIVSGTIGNTGVFSLYIKGTPGQTILITYSGATDRTVTLLSGWNRYDVAGASGTGQIFLNTYGGATARDIEVWGGQVELGSYATSYIPTVASTVTRNADVISKTGISSLIGQTEGTIFIDGIVNGCQNSSANLLNGEKNVNNSFNISYVKSSKNIVSYVYASGVTKSLISGATIEIGQRFKVAYSYKSGDSILYINGVQIGTSADTFTFPNPLNEINIGDAITYFNFQESILNNSVQLYKTRLSDSELQSLTTL